MATIAKPINVIDRISFFILRNAVDRVRVELGFSESTSPSDGVEEHEIVVRTFRFQNFHILTFHRAKLGACAVKDNATFGVTEDVKRGVVVKVTKTINVKTGDTQLRGFTATKPSHREEPLSHEF